jgi:alkylated DNA nucleotide flippase Atl1
VDVQETHIRQILEGAKQYQVPLYQRPYSWQSKQLDRLWEDIVKLADDRRTDPSASHFMGSLVLALGQVGPNGLDFLVVDGQQRLTTISIFLCALRDYVRDHNPGQPMLSDQIHEQYIADRYKQGDDRLKLLPTQADRDPYRSIVERASGADSKTGVGTAYGYFRRQLELTDDPDDPNDIQRIQDAVLDGLAFVSITAKDSDNVYRIFESLNNTGMRLTQGDLLRNYLFMRLGTRGHEMYTTWWLPLQRRLSPADLEQLFWLDAVAEYPTLKQSDIYTFQHARLEKLDNDAIIAEIKRYAGLSELLANMRNPEVAADDPEREGELDEQVRKRLLRLRAWGTTTVDPLLLRLLSLRQKGIATSEQIARAMSAIESFLVRRVIVGGPGAGINRVLLATSSELRADLPVDVAVLQYLSSGRKYFGTDDRVRAAILNEPFYLRGRKNQQKLILQWLDESFGSKEGVNFDKATIEHVLPQTLTPAWRRQLEADIRAGESVEELHESILHTLGNLTLTAYNSELSNGDFVSKRIEFAKSGIRLTNQLAQSADWGRAEIAARGKRLADIAISIWMAPLTSDKAVDSGVHWSTAHKAIMAIPAGNWTTYGDLAALIGTHAVPMGQHVAAVRIPNAWRVLQAAGTISPGFRWYDASDARLPQDVLEAEGVAFDARGRADESRRLHAVDLAQLIGEGAVEDEAEELYGAQLPFVEQLSSRQTPTTVHGTMELMNEWRRMGGTLEYGTNDEVSCFLIAPSAQPGMTIWPLVIYPSGYVEVVFQHLSRRAPFDSLSLREEFRGLLSEIRGIDIDPNRLSLRPSFSLELLGGIEERRRLAVVLAWFLAQLPSAQLAGV